MKFFYSTTLFFGLLCLISCIKDKGTYESKQLTEIEISGIDTFYVVDLGERITIKPKVSFSSNASQDTADYSYKWFADRRIGGGVSPTTVAATYDLDNNITVLKTGYYNMVYRVTEKSTGLFADKYFTMFVSTPDYEGWMLLCDTEDGKSRLDMIARRGDSDTLYRDVLGVVGSDFKTDSKPAFLTMMRSNLDGNQNNPFEPDIFIGTENKAGILGGNNLEFLPVNDFNNFYESEPITNYTGARLAPGNLTSIFYAQNNLYFCYLKIMGPINEFDGEPFLPSPYVAYDPVSQQPDRILFNETSKTFLWIPKKLGYNIRPLQNGTLFNFNVKKDLMYMEYVPYNGGEVFAILKDTATQKVHLARFTTTGVQSYYEEIQAPGIENAENFAISSEFGHIFYTLNNVVYEYDIIVNKNVKMLDYGDRKITMMKFQRFFNAASSSQNLSLYETLGRKLVIGSYDGQDASSSGKLELYTVPSRNQPLRLYKSYEGTGKISHIIYRER